MKNKKPYTFGKVRRARASTHHLSDRRHHRRRYFHRRHVLFISQKYKNLLSATAAAVVFMGPSQLGSGTSWLMAFSSCVLYNTHTHTQKYIYICDTVAIYTLAYAHTRTHTTTRPCVNRTRVKSYIPLPLIPIRCVLPAYIYQRPYNHSPAHNNRRRSHLRPPNRTHIPTIKSCDV